ncbi:hypothetical protein M407DRAFT_10838 [Tulasnella calospora MUT 4182]|uniref:Uncharacterized protein n=1 Tax=Tulasnella calospora MUT 4182 TaxID=1051891 RepID=A0A0C3Q9C6_9AGAM|nr:hypothetical protein M407DRAFT_10838 [Tulasnella calospora MUT 4182]
MGMKLLLLFMPMCLSLTSKWQLGSTMVTKARWRGSVKVEMQIQDATILFVWQEFSLRPTPKSEFVMAEATRLQAIFKSSGLGPASRWLHVEPDDDDDRQLFVWSNGEGELLVSDRAALVWKICVHDIQGNAAYQVAKTILHSREKALMFQLPQETRAIVCRNVEKYLNNPANGCTVPRSLGQDSTPWAVMDVSAQNIPRHELLLVCRRGIHGSTHYSPTINLPFSFLAMETFSLRLYVFHHTDLMLRIRLLCAQGAPYHGDDVVNSPMGPSSIERWVVHHFNNQYRVYDSHRNLLLFLPVESLTNPDFKLSTWVGSYPFKPSSSERHAISHLDTSVSPISQLREPAFATLNAGP